MTLQLGLVLVMVSFLLASCGPNVKGIVEHLAKSDRSWCVAATGYGVNLKVGGSGVGDGDMTCSDGGLALKSQTTQVGVPVLIVPQLSVGAPALIPPPAPPRAPAVPRAVPQSTGPADHSSTLRIDWAPDRAAGALSDADVRDVLEAVRAMHGPRP